jgi:hypothetical protein
MERIDFRYKQVSDAMEYTSNRIDIRFTELRATVLEFEKRIILAINKAFADNRRIINQTLADFTDFVNQIRDT